MPRREQVPAEEGRGRVPHNAVRKLAFTLTYPTLPYPSIPYPTLPYPTLPFHTLPYHTLPYPTKPYPTLPYPDLPSPALAGASWGRTRKGSSPRTPAPGLLSLSHSSRLKNKYFANLLSDSEEGSH